MNLIDQKVTHKNFGVGNIVKCSESTIEIHFTTESKLFIYPDVFKEHLQLQDAEGAKLIEVIIQDKEKEREVQACQQEAAAKLERQKLLLHWEHEKLMKHHKLHPESQMVFWCDTEEQQSVLTDWRVFTGMVKSGNNKGKCNKPIRLHQNSAVVLTARDSATFEKERRILGIYMVEEEFIGALCEDGYVPAHLKYKIELTEEESKQLLFWTYYTNTKTKIPDKISWMTGKYRYFSNLWVAQILVGIIALKKDKAEKELAQQFLKHFCKMNQLIIHDIPMPSGTLTRIS